MKKLSIEFSQEEVLEFQVEGIDKKLRRELNSLKLERDKVLVSFHRVRSSSRRNELRVQLRELRSSIISVREKLTKYKFNIQTVTVKYYSLLGPSWGGWVLGPYLTKAGAVAARSNKLRYFESTPGAFEEYDKQRRLELEQQLLLQETDHK